jgi:hypothetical protein
MYVPGQNKIKLPSNYFVTRSDQHRWKVKKDKHSSTGLEHVSDGWIGIYTDYSFVRKR